MNCLIVISSHSAQTELQGDVTLCCGGGSPCRGVAGVCITFYDLAPSGTCGTISYLSKAALEILSFPMSQDGNFDCIVT